MEWALVAHVDDAGADLDARRPGARYREQRHGRGRLAGDVVDASVGAVDADLVRPDRATAISTASLERPAGVGIAGAATVSVVTEAEESESFMQSSTIRLTGSFRTSTR